MASLINDPNGRRRIQFTNADGERKTLRMGKIDRKAADSILAYIEDLLTAKISGQSPKRATAVWLSDLGAKLKDKLVKVKLIEPDGVPAGVAIGEFLDMYLVKRTDIKPASLVAVRQAVENVKTFFGKDKPLNAIHAGDAEDFKRWHMTGARKQIKIRKASPGLRPATVARRLRRCTAFFADAIKRELITKKSFRRSETSKGKLHRPASVRSCRND